MTPERWQRVKQLFAAAEPLASAERHAYLDDSCGGDALLRAELDSLFAAHAVAEAAVDKPALAHLGEWSDDGADPWLGRRIGAYEIVAAIGRGGMGEVYRARRVDAQFDKEVAIKLVPGGHHASYLLERFRAERQILATLEHPNIARLIDGGAADDGSPYLVMELVDGQPLDRYVEQRNLPLRARLQLFRDVCAAVSYAHQRLVVHRDLKPNNILVTNDGTAKLLDFGIAKLLQAAPSDAAPNPTVTVMRALTPAYSSPEQILGRPITTASDVYSLGVVLFFLLTGRSPYRSTLDTAQDAIRDVCETEPLRPTAAGGRAALDRDLDAIVLRALRKEPESRYASVEQLSEDVRRYLEGLPVRARGDQLGYRTRKFLRRHKLEVGAAALVAGALVVATVVSTRQARIAAEQEAQAEQQRERAERHFASVRSLADVFMFQVHDAIKDLPGSTDARALLVKTALEYLNTLAPEAAGDVGLQLELAAAYEKVGDIQGQVYMANTGEPRAALESYLKAGALLEPIVAADPGNRQARTSLAQSYLRQSQLQTLLDGPATAKESSRRAVQMFEALAEAQPDSVTRRALAAAYAAHAYQLQMDGALESALTHVRRAAGILEALVRERPDDLELQQALGSAYTTAGNMLSVSTDRAIVEEALVLHRNALAIDERLLAATEGRNTTHVRGVMVDHSNIAQTLYELGDFVGAAAAARAAESFVARLRTDPGNLQAKIDDAMISWHLARALLQLEEVDEAESIFAQGVEALQPLAAEGNTLEVQFYLGAHQFGLGTVHERLAARATARVARLDHWTAAKEWHEQAVPHLERVAAAVTLDAAAMRTVNGAVAGLARAQAQLEALAPAVAER